MTPMQRWHLLAAALLLPSTALAQSPAASPRPSWDFSALLVGNFQLRTDSAAKSATGGEIPNRFDLTRAYLTFRAPAGDRASVRITTDVFQNAGTGYYGGWAVRLKYGFLQYDFTRNLAGVDGLAAAGRIGMLQTVAIEHIETFWPRWLGQTAIETAGFFASADLGASTLLTLPNRRGEAYVVVTNGPGYQSPETDRFKDIAARLSLTPFANDSGWMRTFTVTPWYYKGATASAFVLGGPGQVGPVSDGLRRDRHGVFLGLRERKLTVGAEFARRIEELETGLNTLASPRRTRDRTSTLTSAFAILRPLELLGSATRSPLGLVGRVDDFTLDTDADPSSRFVILGATWELNDRVAVALDYQGSTPKDNPAAAPVRTWFLHWTASF